MASDLDHEAAREFAETRIATGWGTAPTVLLSRCYLERNEQRENQRELIQLERRQADEARAECDALRVEALSLGPALSACRVEVRRLHDWCVRPFC